MSDIGLNSFRQNKTSRPISIQPENSSDDKRSMPEDNILSKHDKRLASKDLPKSVRIPLDTHAAISTMASIQNKKMYEIVNDAIEEYIQNLSPQSKKLVRNNVQAIKESNTK